MKEVSMYIRPDKLEKAQELLKRKGCHGMSIMSVMGCGMSYGESEPAPNGQYKGNKINLIPKIKIEVVVEDYVVEDLLIIFHENLSTGTPGDGKIFVKNVENAMRIRTGEQGEKAL